MDFLLKQETADMLLRSEDASFFMQMKVDTAESLNEKLLAPFSVHGHISLLSTQIFYCCSFVLA